MFFSGFASLKDVVSSAGALACSGYEPDCLLDAGFDRPSRIDFWVFTGLSSSVTSKMPGAGVT